MFYQRVFGTGQVAPVGSSGFINATSVSHYSYRLSAHLERESSKNPQWEMLLSNLVGTSTQYTILGGNLHQEKLDTSRNMEMQRNASMISNDHKWSSIHEWKRTFTKNLVDCDRWQESRTASGRGTGNGRAAPWPKGTTFLAWDFIVFWIEGFALFVIGVGHFQTFVKGQSWRRTFLGRQHSWWLLYNVKVLLRLSLPFGQQRAPFKAVSFLGLVVPWSRQFQPILDSFGRGEISVACQCTADQTAVKWVATSLVFSTQKATWSLERWLKDERS